MVRSRNMCSVCQAQIHVASSCHQDVEVMPACGRGGLQLRPDQVGKNHGEVFFFDPACADRMVAIRATHRAGASVSRINYNSSSSHSFFLSTKRVTVRVTGFGKPILLTSERTKFETLR